MREKRRFVRWMGIVLAVNIACSVSGNPPGLNFPEPTPPDQSAQPVSQPDPPFLGVWFSEDRQSIVIFTEDTFYQRVNGAERETYAEIVEYDLENGHILLRYFAIMSGGQQLGFDSPEWHLKYETDGDTLRIAIQSEGYPTAVDSLPFYYDAALSE